jgi:hypothetical protein
MPTRGGAFALTCFEIHGAIELRVESMPADDIGNGGKENDVFDPWAFPDFE